MDMIVVLDDVFRGLLVSSHVVKYALLQNLFL